jgi:transposase-like protein
MAANIEPTLPAEGVGSIRDTAIGKETGAQAHGTTVLPIENLNARYRRAIKARAYFPSEQAALKCLYLVTRSLDPTGAGRARWTMRWKPALNAFAITFADRFPAAEDY